MPQSDTYTNLLGLIEALCGASFGATEQTRVQHLVNRRAWAAYRETDYWPNMLVIGEERAVDNSAAGEPRVPWTGRVYDFTEGIVDRNPYDAAVDTFMRIHRENPWDQKSVGELSFACEAGGARLIGYSASYGLGKTIDYMASTSGGLVTVLTTDELFDAWVGQTIKIDGADSGSGIPDVNKVHTITAVDPSKYLTGATGSTQVQFQVDDGATYEWTLAGDEKIYTPSVFCTYKKRLNGTTYGSSDTTAIPQEWFEYIAHGVFADMLRADQRFEAAQLEEANASMALQRELERIDRMHTIQTVGNRIKTHGTEQARESAHT